MAKFTKEFSAVYPQKDENDQVIHETTIYPTTFAAGDECPKSLEASAKAQGALGDK